MRFAFKTAPQNTTWRDMLAVWQEADDIELFESGWTFDHFYPILSDSSPGMAAGSSRPRHRITARSRRPVRLAGVTSYLLAGSGVGRLPGSGRAGRHAIMSYALVPALAQTPGPQGAGP